MKVTIQQEWWEWLQLIPHAERAEAVCNLLDHFLCDAEINTESRAFQFLYDKVSEQVKKDDEIARKRADAGRRGGCVSGVKRSKTKQNEANAKQNEAIASTQLDNNFNKRTEQFNNEALITSKQNEAIASNADSSDYIYINNNINNINNNILSTSKDIYKEEKYKKEEIKNNHFGFFINGEYVSDYKGSEDEERWAKDIPQPWHSLIMFWCRHKARVGKRYKCKQPITTRYNELVELSNNDPFVACAIIEQSVNNGWAGLFNLKQNQNGEIRKSFIETEREKRGCENAAMLASLLGEGRSNSQADADNTSGDGCF